MSLANFQKALRDGERKMVAESTEAIRSIGQELFSSLSTRAADSGGQGGSPVASGRYVASMRLGINAIDTSADAGDSAYDYPSAEKHQYQVGNLPGRTRRSVAAGRIAAKLRTFKLGDVILISNSVPYARRIEQDGHSWQTPSGVFEVTVRAVARKFRNARLRVFNA